MIRIATMMPRMNPALLEPGGSPTGSAVPPPGVFTFTWPMRVLLLRVRLGRYAVKQPACQRCSRADQPLVRRAGIPRDRLGTRIAQAGELCRDPQHGGRLVAAIRSRAEVGRIGFDQDAICRQSRCRLAWPARRSKTHRE